MDSLNHVRIFFASTYNNNSSFLNTVQLIECVGLFFFVKKALVCMIAFIELFAIICVPIKVACRLQHRRYVILPCNKTCSYFYLDSWTGQ